MSNTTHYENANFLRELAENLPRILPESDPDKAALLQRPANEELARAEYEDQVRAKVTAARADTRPGMTTEQLRQRLHGAMPYDVEWKQGAIEDVTMLFDYIAENSSLWDAQNVTDRVLTAADKLADFPRLYEVDSRYGEDVRRISLMGQHVLYDVDDQTRKVRVLAVVGQRQNPHTVR